MALFQYSPASEYNQSEPWQGDHAHTICHNLDGFPMRKIGKERRTTASLPLHPTVLLKGAQELLGFTLWLQVGDGCQGSP